MSCMPSAVNNCHLISWAKGTGLHKAHCLGIQPGEVVLIGIRRLQGKERAILPPDNKCKFKRGEYRLSVYSAGQSFPDEGI